ncbi:MAG: SusC/RagA family TonB-linked outer membrane protein [Tannerellaceae bacterium]|nr:SusC/RagA family TonB-linked outer membrane protein [Tannerellaceae bacterium]
MKNQVFCMGALLCMLIAPRMTAQEYRIQSVVRAADGPIVGATVLETGTVNGTVTDLDGKFVLTVSHADALVRISYIGYRTVELPAQSGQFRQGVTLEEDLLLLEDVVVIGYGSVKKNDLTGAVIAIKAEEMNRGAVVSAYELLQGKVTGLQVIPGGGEPGTAATFRIRGSSSLNASNDPLIVLDGVPLAQNDFSSINPNDIESFTVLKDASAAAIYGSRASGGVIIITTKKGSPEGKKISLSYHGALSVKQNTQRIDVMDGGEFREFITGIYGDRVSSLLGAYDTDWQSLIFRTGVTHDHSLSASGNITRAIPYRLSVGHTQDEGTMQASWYKRSTVGLNLSPTLLNDHLKIAVNARGSIGTGRNSNALEAAAYFNPTQPPYFYNADGSIDYTTTNGYWNWGSGRGKDYLANIQATGNPLATLYDWHNQGANYGFIGNATVDYKVHGLEDLRLNLNLSTDDIWGTNQRGSNPGSFDTYLDTAAPGVGTYRDTEWSSYNRMLEFYANYNHDFRGHAVDWMGGYSWQHKYSHSLTSQRYNADYSTYAKDEIFGNEVTDDKENYLISFFTRLNYSYKSRYLFTFTLRDDASSRFSPETRWGLFPSAALAWNVAEEDFFRSLPAVSALKFRLGWGVTGQQDIGENNYYPYIARYSMSTDTRTRYPMGASGFSYLLTPQAYDPNIKWEETETYNAAIDYGLFNNRIHGSVDFFLRKTKDLLNSVSIPLGSNFSNTLLTNVGSIENKGLEIALNLIPVSTKDLSVTLGFTGTFQETKFTKLTFSDDENYGVQVGTILAGTGGFLQLHKVGYAPYAFYCYQQVYDTNGKPIQNALVDRNGDGLITSGDRYMVNKHPDPDFYYGVNLKINYRNWDFGFNAHGSVGNWMFNDIYNSHSTSAITLGYNMVDNYARTVLKTGWTDTSSDAQNYSDYWLENASFFRLDDINAGYTFRLPQYRGLSFRIAASVQNVFVITPYSGIDPESMGAGSSGNYRYAYSASSTGIDRSIYPRPRVYALRLNINF